MVDALASPASAAYSSPVESEKREMEAPSSCGALWAAMEAQAMALLQDEAQPAQGSDGMADASASPVMILPASTAALDKPAVGALSAAPPSPFPPGQGPQMGKPQQTVPTNAMTARGMVFAELEELLASDDSRFALDPSDRAALHEAIQHSRETIVAGIPKGTLKSDDNGARWAANFCIRHDTPFVRPLVLLTQADKARESFMYARFTVETAELQKPRSHNKVAEDGSVITDAKPSSALGPLYGWRRILRDGGCELPPLSMVRAHLKGLVAKHKHKWGKRAMVPERRRPFDQQMLHAIAATVQSETMVKTGGWTTEMNDSVGLAFKFGLSTGVRADELTNEADHLVRLTFVILKGKRELPPSRENLRGVRDGDLIQAYAPPSKCDRDNMEWGDRKMYFRVRFDDPLNFAAAWVLYELAHPCPVEERGTWAMVSPDGGASPFSTQALQRRFHDLMVESIGETEAKLRSFHALRVTAATALNTAKRPDGAIQMVLRWKTLEAMRLYAKMDCSNYADLVDEITSTQVDVARADKLPNLGPDDELTTLQAMLTGLEFDEETAAAYVLDGTPLPSSGDKKRTAARGSAPGGSSTGAGDVPLGGSMKRSKAQGKRKAADAPPPPCLQAGDRVEIYWTDEKESFVGTFTSSRVEETSDGCLQRVSRIAYDAVPGRWRAEYKWHCLDKEEWKRL